MAIWSRQSWTCPDNCSFARSGYWPRSRPRTGGLIRGTGFAPLPCPSERCRKSPDASMSIPSLISVKRSLLHRRILSARPADKALYGEGRLDLPCCLAIQYPPHPRSDPRRYLQETCRDEFSPPNPQPPNRRSVMDPVFCSSSAKHRCRADAVAASVTCQWERVPDTCSASRFRKRPEREGLRPPAGPLLNTSVGWTKPLQDACRIPCSPPL